MVRILKITLIGSHQLLQYIGVLSLLDKIKYFYYHGILHLILETHPKLSRVQGLIDPPPGGFQTIKANFKILQRILGDLVQGLRTNFIPNAEGKQRIKTETSTKYYADHIELWYDSEEKDKSTAGSFEFKALEEDTVYRCLYSLSF